MPPLVVVSNRGPLSFRLGADDRLVRRAPGGGLAGTLHPLLRGTGTTWVACSMNEADRRAAAEGLMVEEGLAIELVQPDERTYKMAYDVIANATLWFCHHHLFDLPRRPRLDRHWHEAWDAYRHFNRLFADAVGAGAPEGAVVLVQDYHLSLVGSMLEAERADLRTVHFSHTPFADPAALRTLPRPAARELLAGMAGFGVCGFHTERWAGAFRAAFDDPELAGEVSGTGPRTFVAPLGPDVAAITEEAAAPDVAAAERELDRLVAGRRLIVRVDRIELSKNVLRGC